MGQVFLAVEDFHYPLIFFWPDCDLLVALSAKSRNKFPLFLWYYCLGLSLDPAVPFQPLNQNGGLSAVLPRADGPRVGGLGKEELVL